MRWFPGGPGEVVTKAAFSRSPGSGRCRPDTAPLAPVIHRGRRKPSSLHSQRRLLLLVGADFPFSWIRLIQNNSVKIGRATVALPTPGCLLIPLILRFTTKLLSLYLGMFNVFKDKVRIPGFCRTCFHSFTLKEARHTSYIQK